MLSGHLDSFSTLAKLQKQVYFPEAASTNPWTKVDQNSRYYLSFPAYPFRTLCPRDQFTLQTKAPTNEFNSAASSILPAHTQLNITFKRRPLTTNFLPFMLAHNLDPIAGTRSASLTAGEFTTARQFSLRAAGVGAAAGAVTNYLITKVDFVIADVYLQVKNTIFLKTPSSFSHFFSSPA